jgi:hypothetical protein
MKILCLSLVATALVGCSVSVPTESGLPETDLGTVGVPPGTNPSLATDQQVAAFRALQHATSVHFPTGMNREAFVTRSEIRDLLAKLSMTQWSDQPAGESVLCLTFKLPNGREIPVHVWPDCWSFTGGPKRHYGEDLWKHLKLDQREQ